MSQAGKIHKDRVYAFLDKRILNVVTRDHGWILDLSKFRKYLHRTYAIEKAFILIRYFEQDKELHKTLQKEGYICLFISPEEKDEEFLLDVVLRDKTFDKAIIISGNDDYRVLIEKLAIKNTLLNIFIPQSIPTPAFVEYADKLISIGTLRKELEKGRKLKKIA